MEAARFHVDAPEWFRSSSCAPSRHDPVGPRRPTCEARLQREGRDPPCFEVEPLGLVAKAGNWYLVARSRHRIAVYRVDRIVKAELLPERFARPVGFELATFWTDWSREFEFSRPSLVVKVRINPHLWDALPEIFGEAVGARMDAGSAPDRNGWRVIELTFESTRGCSHENFPGSGLVAMGGGAE